MGSLDSFDFLVLPGFFWRFATVLPKTPCKTKKSKESKDPSLKTFKNLEENQKNKKNKTSEHYSWKALPTKSWLHQLWWDWHHWVWSGCSRLCGPSRRQASLPHSTNNWIKSIGLSAVAWKHVWKHAKWRPPGRPLLKWNDAEQISMAPAQGWHAQAKDLLGQLPQPKKQQNQRLARKTPQN